MKRILSTVFALFVLGACSNASTATPISITLVDPEDLPTSTFTDPAMRQAEEHYQIYCAHCHGYEGGGQVLSAPGESARVGLKLVPPHDASGETWRYADPLLVQVIQKGIQNPLDHYPMPPFESLLDEAETVAILDYMRLWWTDAQREYQAVVTANYLLAQDNPSAEFAPLPPVDQ